MIKIKTITPPFATVKSPSGKTREVNEYEFLDLRLQIKVASAEGWAVVCDDVEYVINKEGVIEHYPKSLFPEIVNYLDKLTEI